MTTPTTFEAVAGRLACRASGCNFAPFQLKETEMKKALMLRLAAVQAAALAASGAAHAALPTEVTTGITTAQTDIVAMLGALTAAGIAIWVVAVIYNKFRVKA